MPVLAVIGSPDVAADLREAPERFAAGYRAFKIKVGFGAAGADAERTRSVCQALKSAGEPAWCLPTPIRVSALKRRSLMCECLAIAGSIFSSSRSPRTISTAWRAWPRRPCANRRRRGHAFGDDIVRHHERKAARGVSLKAIKLGGVRALFEAGEPVRSARHERQHFLQDRRIERRLGGGPHVAAAARKSPGA